MTDKNNKQIEHSLTYKINCAIYTRTDTDTVSDSELTHDAQFASCAAFIKLRGSGNCPILPAKYRDCDPEFTMNRPGLKRLISDVEAGLVDIVVVSSLDRLSSTPEIVSELLEIFRDNNVRLILVPIKRDALHSFADELKYKSDVLMIEGIIGDYYSDDILMTE